MIDQCGSYYSPTAVMSDHDPVHRSFDGAERWDVLCGRGASLREHPGNKVLDVFVHRHRDRYATSSNAEKATIVNEIYESIKSDSSMGTRFLKRDPFSNTWEEVDDEAAKIKISHCFRSVYLRRSELKQDAELNEMIQRFGMMGPSTAKLSATVFQKPVVAEEDLSSHDKENKSSTTPKTSRSRKKKAPVEMLGLSQQSSQAAFVKQCVQKKVAEKPKRTPRCVKRVKKCLICKKQKAENFKSSSSIDYNLAWRKMWNLAKAGEDFEKAVKRICKTI